LRKLVDTTHAPVVFLNRTLPEPRSKWSEALVTNLKTPPTKSRTMKNRIKLATCVAVLATGLSTSFAQFTVMTGDGLPSDGLFSSLSREAPRVLQQFYSASFFTSITAPAEITAMSFRLPPVAADNYPALGDLNFARYEITLAQPSAGVAAANWLTSATFADNMVDPVQVRSGALTIPLASFCQQRNGRGCRIQFHHRV
jgi:hypothetical protein